MNLMQKITALLDDEMSQVSQECRKPKTLDTRRKSLMSQVSQQSTIKSQIVTCNGCKHQEEIPPHGSGCTYKTKGEYPNIWSLQDILNECPRGYWN